MELFYLEGGGGSGLEESYDLAFYFMANKVKMDCYEKRNRKGYLFCLGDEPSYPTLNKDWVRSIIGDNTQESLQDTIDKLLEKFNVYFIIPRNTNHGKNEDLHDYWRNYFGQNVLIIDDVEDIAEVIASTIGVNEGRVDIYEASSNAGKDLTTVLSDVGLIKVDIKSDLSVDILL